uniref:zinc finger protein 37 homolog n=1 Tax=Doryrhamphus excisus TaxID=161450 RepID=UPI0025AE34B9|nr:zinc finger protein 37 homolog [Doryrhamphus excisus]
MEAALPVVLQILKHFLCCKHVRLSLAFNSFPVYNMSAFCFQTQLVSIMDALSKAAVMEIGKLVEIESKMLKIEITRGRNEVASLTEKLHLMEKLLRMAQRGKQDTGVGLENSVLLEPDRTRPVIKSDFPWDNNNSSPLQEEETPAFESAQEQPELMVVKQEPVEVEDGESEQERTPENTDTQKSPDVSQHSKERLQPVFPDCIVTLNAPPSLPAPEHRNAQWNPQLPPGHTNQEPAKSSPQIVASPLRSVKMHNLRNSTAKKFGCLQCGKSFRCYSQLEIHQRSHTGEKPFRCTLCGKRYAQKGHLYTHQRTHTGEKPYRCPVCGKGFIQKCTLDMHQRTHTGEKPFVCVQCGKGFTKNCNLKKHLLVHLDPDLQMYGNQSTAAFRRNSERAKSSTPQCTAAQLTANCQSTIHSLSFCLIHEGRSGGEISIYTAPPAADMMCDTSNRNFRTQLAVILEKITKTALVEIGNLADEFSSVLLGEISLHKSENEALKKKCYSLEVQLRAAREAQYYPAHVNNIGRRNPEGQEPHKSDQQHQQAAPAIDGVFGKDWCMDLWREDKRVPPQRKETVEPVAMSSMGTQVLDIMDREPDLIFVKEETYDDHPLGQQRRMTDNRKDMGMLEAESALHRSVSELQLHSEDLSSFPLMVDGQAQRSQPSIMDKLIEDAAMSTMLDNNTNPPATSSEYVDYTNAAAKDFVSYPPKPTRPPKHFQCLFCGKVFNYLSSLKVHVRRHSGEKPFSCTVCGKRFAQKTYLKLHQRVHSGEKPYSCPDCGRSFSQKSSLNIHFRTHTGEKPYSCVDCGKCYAYKYGLNHHQCFNHMKNT